MTTDRTLNTQNLERTGAILSADPAQAMQEMMNTIDALRNLYAEENEALRQADLQTFMGLQERKIHLARDYQQGVGECLKRKDELRATVDDKTRRALSGKQEEFAALTRENVEALERMRKTTSRLSTRILQVARDVVSRDQARYGATGNLHTQERAVSIGVNESA